MGEKVESVLRLPPELSIYLCYTDIRVFIVWPRAYRVENRGHIGSPAPDDSARLESLLTTFISNKSTFYGL
jgi:hypothetical protein